MKLKKALNNIDKILLQKGHNPVDFTIAKLLQSKYGNKKIEFIDSFKTKKGFKISSKVKDCNEIILGKKIIENDIFFQIDEKGEGFLLSSQPNFLYGFVDYLLENYSEYKVDNKFQLVFNKKFKWHRSLYDVYIAQTGRTNRNFNLEDYFKELAEMSITHVEVNALAYHSGVEQGVAGEVYPRFYTYCPALDQFTDSFLNKGIYREDYLKANLNRLKKNAELALKYGITPGLLCFEPRSVPETLLNKYPMLRGARVDHPLRSLKPRYNLAVCHPVVRKHYRELLQNLLKEVPELAFLSIWTNDSGAGFELTKSLYVGPNTSGYLIREWKSDEENSQAAAGNIINFLTLLRDVAKEINPDFKIITRREAFYAEEDFIYKNIEKGIDFEVFSHLMKGFESTYKHPVYNDVDCVIGTLFQKRLKEDEKKEIERFKKKGADSHLIYAPGMQNNFEPLIGIPFPWFVYERLESMYEFDIDYTVYYGGGAPKSLAPFNINQEVVREFIYGKEKDVDKIINKTAIKWVGEKYANKLIEIWRLTEEGIKYYQPIFLYSQWGITWYRLWIRPIVPNIENIPEEDREYYEKYMLTTPHNPTRVDLNRDVGFTLMPLGYAKNASERINENVWNKLDKALYVADEVINSESDRNVSKVFIDQRDRIKALKCWIRTLKNVCVWIYNVHSYLNTDDYRLKKKYRENLKSMVLDEIENAKELLDLWQNSETEFMQISHTGETTFIYDENIGDYIKRKIKLMKGRENDEPYINKNIIWTIWEN